MPISRRTSRLCGSSYKKRVYGSPICLTGHSATNLEVEAPSSRRFVCRESSILRGDGGSVMTVSPSRPEARRRFGSQTANELGAPVASSIPEQLPGREPASARKGYERIQTLQLLFGSSLAYLAT